MPEAVVVINGVRRGRRPLRADASSTSSDGAHGSLTVPWDPALETGAQTLVSSLRADTRASLVEVAAAVADSFPARREAVR